MRPALHTGFTLIELLIVISLITTLAAILFPVFSQVREDARRSACASNLHQIGVAITLYSQDSDDRYPIGVDSVDHGSYLWEPAPEQLASLPTLPLLRDVVHPYLKSHEVWHCPSDSGSKRIILYDSTGGDFDVKLNPTAYNRLGTSYMYRLQLGMDGILLPGDCSIGDPPNVEYMGPAFSAVLVDAAPTWHGDASSLDSEKYNVLYADGHVHIGNGTDFIRAWLCDPQ